MDEINYLDTFFNYKFYCSKLYSHFYLIFLFFTKLKVDFLK